MSSSSGIRRDSHPNLLLPDPATPKLPHQLLRCCAHRTAWEGFGLWLGAFCESQKENKDAAGTSAPFAQKQSLCDWMAQGASVLMQAFGLTLEATRALCAAQRGRGQQKTHSGDSDRPSA